MCYPRPAAMTPLLVAVYFAILGCAAAQPFTVNGTFAPRFVIASAKCTAESSPRTDERDRASASHAAAPCGLVAIESYLGYSHVEVL